MKTRLRQLIVEPSEVNRLFHAYTLILTSPLELNHEIALKAIELRESVRPRLPLVDSVIAATAKVHNAVLVQRDPHLAAIPATVLKQIVLPSKHVV